jgi:hypothetical protein
MEKLNTKMKLTLRSSNSALRVIVLLISLIISSQAFSVNYYVNDNSTTGDVFCTAVSAPSNSGLSPAIPMETLTDVWNTYGPLGTNVITSGDTIFVDAGIYLGTDANLVLDVNGIAVVGAGMQVTEFDNDLNSADANRLFTITADNIYLANFSVQGYNRGTGGAFAIQFNGALGGLVENVLTYENDAGGGSSAIVITNGSELIFNGGGSTCNSSLSIAGGGVNVEGAGNVVVFNGYTFKDNFKAAQEGSGLYVNGGSDVTISNSLFEGNISGSSNGGGALYATGNCNITISGSCFLNNTASSGASSTIYGGAILAGRGVVLNINNCNFEGNSAPRGGAIAINTALGSSGADGIVNLDNCSFSGNSASSRGIDLFARVGSSRPSTYSINESTFTGTSDDIRNDNSASITISNSGVPSTNGSVVFANVIAPILSPTTGCPSLVNPCLPTPLPVELLSFNSFCQNEERVINWQTSSEKNNAYFILERAESDLVFDEIAVIDGQGTTQVESNYEFIDSDMVMDDIVYYQLSQVDYDGRSEVFPIIAVQNDCKSEDDLLANYNQLNQTISLFHTVNSSDIERINVYAVNGQVIFSQDDFSNQKSVGNRIQLDRQPANGIYIIELISTSKVLSTKIIIQ